MAGSISNPPAFDLSQLAILAPPALQAQLVVAGGYLVSPAVAGDIDLWLLDPYQNQDVLRDEVMEWLYGRQDSADWELFRPGSDEDGLFPPEYSKGNLGQKGYHFVGTFQREDWPKPVQFFLTPYKTVDELLQDFDISTHQRARFVTHPERGMLIARLTTTSITELPRVTNFDTPATTLARLEKFCLRYGFSIDNHPDLDRLRSAIDVPDFLFERKDAA